MMRKTLKIKKHFNNKKGFSLLELLCAIMIMAIAVSATATGLAVSYQSITKNSLMNQASAKAQMFCDLVMTYVEKTPSNDPSEDWNSVGYTIPATAYSPEAKYVLNQSANKLFASNPNPNPNYTFTDEIKNNIKIDVLNLDSTMTDVKQYSSGTIGARPFNKAELAYVIEKEGSFLKDKTKSNTPDNIAVTYKITVYVDYGTNGNTYCTGTVTKDKYNSFNLVTPP